MSSEEINKQTPEKFFETIGDKVKNFNSESDAGQDDEQERRPVEEIESLCMNCHENVSILSISSIFSIFSIFSTMLRRTKTNRRHRE